MANLDALFNDNGLQAIIPYAVGAAAQGYKFLCQKLRDGVSFWIIVSSDSKMPFFSAVKEKVYFSLYSTSEQANFKCAELAMANYFTEPVMIDSIGWSTRLWKRYRDLGATYLQMDDAVWINMLDLTPAATYNGILNGQTPLRNDQLNPAIYCLLQAQSAGEDCSALSAYFWRTFKESRLYAPMRPIRSLNPGESLTINDCDYHYAALQNDCKALLCFTDADFLTIYAESLELSPEEYTVVVTPGYDEIRSFIHLHPDIQLLINIGAGNMILNETIISEFEMIELNQSATDVCVDS